MPDIPWTYVTRLLSAAANAAEERGVAVAVCVTDRDGGVIGAVRMPGAPRLLGELAAAKAHTAATFRRDSVEVGALADAAPSVLAAAGELADHPVITDPGGVAIADAEQVVGAIGVAGGTGEQDVEIGRAALAAHPIGAWIRR